MDVIKMIQELLEERARIDATISRLEDLQNLSEPPRRSGRGRKGMTAAEREEVSRRMRTYWEKRRAQTKAAKAAGAGGGEGG